MHLRRRSTISARTALVISLLACALPSAAYAANRPDLSVSGVQVLTPSVLQGGQVRLSVVVRNAGKAGAPASAVGLYLSTDKRKNKADKHLSGLAKVKSLPKGARVTVSANTKLPKSVKPGAYVLFACADDKSRAKESNERNNCRPTTGKVGVTRAAKPVGVAPQLDTANALDAPVSADGGGTVVAIGADGTTYSLVVPDGALTHDVRITLTPVTAIGGLPLSGGLVAGVQIDTDALQLAKPAQLVIQRQGLAPAPSQVAFGYHNAGSDFFLSPFGQRPPGYPSEAIAIPVLHGGGYGIANANAADVAAQKAKLPAHPDDALAQAAAGLGGAAKRSARGARAAAFDPAALLPTARELYAQRIQPEMTAAETNDALLGQATADAFGWMREVILLGLEDNFQNEFAQITNSMMKGVNNAYEQAKKKCLAGDYSQVTRLLQIERFRQLMGFGDEKSTISQDVDNCLSFELRVTSHIEVHEQASGHVDEVSDLSSTVPLQFDFNTQRLDGQAPFEYKHFSLDSHVTANGCTRDENANGTLVNSVLSVPKAFVSVNDPGAPPKPPEVNMTVNPGQPQEGIHFADACAGNSDSGDYLDSRWYFEWTTFFHNGQIADNSLSGPWFFDKFTPGVPPVVGTLEFHMQAGARSINETWQVVHTPKP